MLSNLLKYLFHRCLNVHKINVKTDGSRLKTPKVSYVAADRRCWLQEMYFDGTHLFDKCTGGN